MGTRKTVDGTETAVITLRLPTWVLAHASGAPEGQRAYLREILIRALSGSCEIRYEIREEDQIGE